MKATTTVCWPLEVPSIQPALAGCQDPGWKVKVKVAQSCPTLCDPMDYTVHGVLQARILEWVAFPFSRDLPNPGMEPRSPALQADSLPAEPPGKPRIQARGCKFKHIEEKDWTRWIQSSKKNLAGETGVWIGILVSFSEAVHPAAKDRLSVKLSSLYPFCNNNISGKKALDHSLNNEFLILPEI